ncbi:acyl-CoA dehydrogenase family protein [Williamsia sterculiae]|uniref:Acyl-CoA dehydrogenase n=1 Tax=Williamsia sterculiae TaxID=1344003 RepID=A0A1N7DY36_9NOCA|nr:acyl-CoA dehydrogenase family protein [Williamsia sterculiae]SIR80753.1 Acyl-CoA dehydrogenase [Williamsia sterculiae]
MTAATRIVADRSAVLGEIGEGAAERERRGKDPHEQIQLLRDAGLTALSLDAAHGGGDADVVELLDFIVDLAHADPIVAHILRAHFWFVEQIKRLPDGPVRERWSTEIAHGKIFGNASSERRGTAGTRRFATRLRTVHDGPVGDGWLLTGEKFYSTGTAFADYVAVQAALDESVARVVVPLDRAGVRVLDDWDGIGQHRTGTGSTELVDVVVRPTDVLSLTATAATDAPPVANDGPLLQLFLQALITGILQSVTDDAVELVRGRIRTFDHAPAAEPRHDPVLLQTIGEVDAAATVARAAVRSAAQDVERAFACARDGVIDTDLFEQASLAAARVKVHVDRVALPAATSLFDVGGASAASRTRNLDRHWRNIRTITLHNPTSYKAIAIGDLLVNETALPANGYF